MIVKKAEPSILPEIPDHVLAAFGVLTTRWPAQTVTPETMRLYAACLCDVAPRALVEASVLAARTETFFPGPNRLLELAASLRGPALSAEEAWAEVIGLVRKVGYMGAPKFSSPAVERAVEGLGGWRAVCSQETRDVPANRAHFMRMYSAFAASKAREGHVAALPGALEALALGGRGSVAQIYGPDYRDAHTAVPSRDEKPWEPSDDVERDEEPSQDA